MIFTGSTGESDALISEIDRQRGYERIKKDGFDVNEELRRSAAEDAEDAENDDD